MPVIKLNNQVPLAVIAYFLDDVSHPISFNCVKVDKCLAALFNEIGRWVKTSYIGQTG